MSNKSKTILVCLITTLLIVFILCVFVLMGIKDVKVNFLYSSNELNENEIITAINENDVVPYGSSILFINKNAIENKIEKLIPKLKVKNVEAIFPNSISINCYERNQLFSIKDESTNMYYILDEEMKVVDKITQAQYVTKNFVELNIKPEITKETTILELGAIVDFKYYYECSSLITYIVNKYKDNSNASVFCNHFTKIEFEQGYNSNGSKVASVCFYTASNKKVEIEEPTRNLKNRAELLLSYFVGENDILQDDITIL